MNEYDFEHMTGRLFALEVTFGILCRALALDNPKALIVVAHHLNQWDKAPANQKLLLEMSEPKQQAALETFALLKQDVANGLADYQKFGSS